MLDFISFLAACLGFIVVHPFLVMPLFFLLAFIISYLKKIFNITFPKWTYALAGLLFIFLFLNSFLGKIFLFKVINAIGIESIGIVGESRPTNMMFNKRILYEYDLYIYKNPEKDTNDIIKVTIDDMFLPYYGKFAKYLNKMPPIGTKLPVKYIKNFYKYFIIPTDTNNPFILQELCLYYLFDCSKKRELFKSLKNKDSAKEYYSVLSNAEKCNCDTFMFNVFYEDKKELEKFLSENK